MKRTILFFTLIVGLSFTSFSKEKVDGLVFDSLEYNYGEISNKSDGISVFTFKNESKLPVTITNVKTTCGCTSPEWPKGPLEKGKKGEVHVRYNTAIIGSFTKTITVTTSAKQSIVLTIKGQVKKD